MPDLSTQTSLTSFFIDPPGAFDFLHPEEWKNWLVRYNRYCNISGLNQLDQKTQIDTLIYTMGQEAERVFNALNLNQKDRKLYNLVFEKLERHFDTPMVNVIAERAKFYKRDKYIGESVEGFIEELYKLSENCGFGLLREEQIRDRIVSGISDVQISETLKSDPKLTLKKAIVMVRNSDFPEVPSSPSSPSSPVGSAGLGFLDDASELEKLQPTAPSDTEFSSSLAVPQATSDAGPGKKLRGSRKITSTYYTVKQGSHIRYRYPCPICKKICKRPSGFQIHMKTHDKIFPCDLCIKKFTSDIKLSTHKQNVHPTFTCDMCEKQFTSEIKLNKHNQNVHPISKKKTFTCKVCKEVFSEKKDLRKHRQKHAEKACCEVCGELVSNRYSLSIHMRIHTGEKPFSCDYCDKRFSSNPQLKKHKIGIHSGEKPFCCELCGKTFPFKSSLKRHLKIHTGEKRTTKTFPCACGKVFSQKQKLQRHMRIHTGEKPFSCDMCDYRCAQKYNLKTHKRGVHRNCFEKTVSGGKGSENQRMNEQSINSAEISLFQGEQFSKEFDSF